MNAVIRERVKVDQEGTVVVSDSRLHRGDEVEVITPADTWYRPLPTKPWFVTDPSFDANVRFGFSPGRQ